MKSMLVLEDGSVFDGVSASAAGERIGEVILNTSVVGYQEMMTDPANAGKILVFTYPLIGNYGVAKKFYESRKVWAEAVVAKEISRIYSNYQAEESFQSFVRKEDVFVLSDADTRTIAVKISRSGEMLGIVSSKGKNSAELLKKLKEYKANIKNDFISKISVKKPTEYKVKSPKYNIGILDIGILNSFIKSLNLSGCSVTLLPYNTSSENILKSKFDGIVISSGPEDDISIPGIVSQVRNLIGKIPILGISTGHEIIGLALGGKIKKMKLGHRGVNYPVKSSSSDKGEITVQNHSFVLDEGSLINNREVKVTLKNINDNSVEEIDSKSLKIISVQYYPVSSGFDEVNDVFTRFLNYINAKVERELKCQSVKI